MIAIADYDWPTRSASGFLVRYILPRTAPPQLVGPLDNKPLFTTLNFGDYLLVMGHGSPSELFGQNEVLLMDTNSIPNVEKKFVRFLSCETGQILGPAIIRAGATGFHGYTEDFTWVMDGDSAIMPWEDEMAAKALMPVVNSINAILDGKTSQEAFCLEIKELDANIVDEEDELIRSCLEFNRDHAIMLGDPNAKIGARPAITLPIPPPPALAPLPEV